MRALLLLLGAFVATAAGVSSSADTPERRALPAPARHGGATLADVLATRRSIRTFGDQPLDDAQLGQLLWAAQGITDGHRTAPSAGARYPLSIYVADARGAWRYVPAEHALVSIPARDAREQLGRASGGDDAVTGAPVIIVVSAQFGITARKYGARAERYATLEAGHAAQNVLLTATALGLGAVPIGAFDDAIVSRTFGLGSADTPLYVIPIGHPR